MLKDNLYRYGYLTKILNTLFILLVFLMYLGTTINYISVSKVNFDLYNFSIFLLFFILVIKCLWYFCVTRPMCFTNKVINCFLVKLNLFVIYLILFVIIINSIFIFILNSYMAYLVDIKMQTPYTFLNITIIPFSIIRLIGFLLENNLHINIANFKDILHNCTSVLFKIILPSFIFLFMLQLVYSKRIYKYF